MDIRLGRQLAAVPSRLVVSSKHVLAVRPLRLCPSQHTHHSWGLPGQHRCAAEAGNAYGQPAISINSEASAVPEPPGQPDVSVPVPVPAAADGHSNNSQPAAVPAAGQAAAEAEQPQQQLSQRQQQPQQAGKKKVSEFINRVIFGIILGFGGAAVVAKGSLLYLCATMFVVYHATQEFYGFLTSSGISQGMPPPSPFVSVATTALCLSITIFTYFSHGRSGAAMSAAAFCLLVLNVLGTPKPKFAQLASSVFGLFYCGYLPSFWIKLRNLDVTGPQLQLPGVSPEVIAGITAWLPDLTVGLIATLTTVACIIAADTGAYFVGKNLGRTKLTDISPKKTVEGALGGLASAVAVAVLFWKLFSWPGNVVAAAGYGVLTFTSSLFGDLIESIMKRDAGLKDSGNLIPGHGGLLDRFDSYIFSGALGYFYITALLPRLGLA